jgi:hypothetical protein
VTEPQLASLRNEVKNFVIGSAVVVEVALYVKNTSLGAEGFFII